VHIAITIDGGKSQQAWRSPEAKLHPIQPHFSAKLNSWLGNGMRWPDAQYGTERVDYAVPLPQAH
jgi:hypothetical protein